MTGMNIGVDAKERIRVMTTTGDGFEIAEKDLELRGPGDIEGTRQSGVLNFRLANIVQDKPLLETAGKLAARIIDNDPDLVSAENLRLKDFLSQQKSNIVWSKIS
jgi:ATP-dependent DNA helicase RecG